MRKEEISTSQAYLLITSFIIGTSLALTGFAEALQDTWISILLAMGFGSVLVMIYGSIMNRFSRMDLYQVLEFLFGKVAGKIIGFLYSFYFLHLSAICIRNITEYIQVVSFPETPQYFTGLFLCLLSIYILKSGLEVMARVNKFLLLPLVLMLVTTFIMGVPKGEVSNLLPILYNGWSPVIKASFSPFAFPFGETVVFMTILNNVSEQKKSKKIFLIGLYGGGIILLAAVFRNILLLGFPNLSISNFPSYYATTLIDIGNYIRGLELVVSTTIIIAGFIKIATCLLGACIGFSRVFKFSDYKWISVPLGLLILSLSLILYEDTIHMVEWIEIYKYYALVFQVFFPLIIFICGIFKKKKYANP